MSSGTDDQICYPDTQADVLQLQSDQLSHRCHALSCWHGWIIGSCRSRQDRGLVVSPCSAVVTGQTKRTQELARVSTQIHFHKDAWVQQGDLIKLSEPLTSSSRAVEHQMLCALASFRLHFHHLVNMIQSDVFGHMKNYIF